MFLVPSSSVTLKLHLMFHVSKTPLKYKYFVFHVNQLQYIERKLTKRYKHKHTLAVAEVRKNLLLKKNVKIWTIMMDSRVGGNKYDQYRQSKSKQPSCA